MQYTVLYLLGHLVALTFAADLQKESLTSSLAYLHDGLYEHLPLTPGKYSQWKPGWIPEDCQQIIYSKNLLEIDVEVYQVLYDDCDAPWILCRHKDSLNPIGMILDHFGRVPVRARTYIRHVVDFPDHNSKTNYAFNANDNIALVNHADATLAVFIHETGHSLDGHNVYKKTGLLSKSKKWSDAYGKDSKVPDDYSQTNFAEDVAQNTVVAAYDLNVPDGFQKVQKDWKTIENQYSLIKTLADQAGKAFSDPGNILMPGGRCGQRLRNSDPVRTVKPVSRRGAIQARGQDKAPDVSLPDHIEVIQRLAFSTEEICPHP